MLFGEPAPARSGRTGKAGQDEWRADDRMTMVAMHETTLAARGSRYGCDG